jgi:hypothetical protein
MNHKQFPNHLPLLSHELYEAFVSGDGPVSRSSPPVAGFAGHLFGEVLKALLSALGYLSLTLSLNIMRSAKKRRHTISNCSELARFATIVVFSFSLRIHDREWDF